MGRSRKRKPSRKVGRPQTTPLQQLGKRIGQDALRSAQMAFQAAKSSAAADGVAIGVATAHHLKYREFKLAFGLGTYRLDRLWKQVSAACKSVQTHRGQHISVYLKQAVEEYVRASALV